MENSKVQTLVMIVTAVVMLCVAGGGYLLSISTAEAKTEQAVTDLTAVIAGEVEERKKEDEKIWAEIKELKNIKTEMGVLAERVSNLVKQQERMTEKIDILIENYP